MAKQTFINLPEEKKNKIIKSLKKEFSRASLKDALVSNIVKEAGIPRGSFYQYFEDIEDSYYYVIEEYSNNIKKFLIEDLRNNNGDIILAYRHLYIYILDMIDNKNNKEYFEKIFLNMSYEVQSMFTPNFNDGLNLIINYVDCSKLNIASKFGLGYVLDIIESTMMNSIIKSYKRNLSREKNIEIFEKELALICVGVLKK
ncbi:MAG: TetR family transcriptional regulator [Bacilli bacterium]|nr:TetR family transcriptional regulator [Bacilli bacterium]